MRDGRARLGCRGGREANRRTCVYFCSATSYASSTNAELASAASVMVVRRCGAKSGSSERDGSFRRSRVDRGACVWAGWSPRSLRHVASGRRRRHLT